MSDLFQPRHRNGRFAEKVNADAGTQVVTDADIDQVERWVESPDRLDRERAARDPGLSDEHAERLSGPDQPVTVRLALVDRLDAKCLRRAAADPDPVVRWAVWHHGVGLSADDRRRLDADPQVGRVADLLGR